MLQKAVRGATWIAMAMAMGAATPAAAELIDSSDPLLQKARPQTFDLSMRKQLCARSGFDGNCRDGLPSVKLDLLQPLDEPEDEPPPFEPIVELPPVQELLPPDSFDKEPPAIVPAAAAVSVPEPSAIGVLLLAAAGLASRRARRSRK